VAKRFDSVVALKAAALQVRPGEVHGLMGSNGAGKSTLVKIITGVFPADGGQILVKRRASLLPLPRGARSAGIVSVYQDPALVPDLTVAQNMRLAGASVEAVRKWLAELGVVRLDFSILVRDLPYPTLRLIDLAARSRRSRRSSCSTKSRLRFRRTCPSGFTRWSGTGASATTP